MKSVFLSLLFLGNLGFAAQSKTTCLAVAESEAQLAASLERLCLTTYSTAGVPVGNVDIAFYAAEKAVPGGEQPKRIKFASVSYRHIYGFEPKGKLTLTLIERGDSPFAKAVEGIRVLAFTKAGVDGASELGTLLVGKSETEGKKLFYRVLP